MQQSVVAGRVGAAAPVAPTLGRRIRRTRSGWLPTLSRRPLVVLTALILLGMFGLAILAPVVAPYDPLKQDSAAALAPPGQHHLLGTDQLGRDLLSRVIWGAQTALGVGLLTVGVATSLGTIVGIVAAYFGGWVDFALQRTMDTVMAFPPIVMAIAVLSVLGTGSINVGLALGVVYTPTVNRVIRGVTLSIREQQHIEAARAIGCGNGRILWRYILPNVLPSVIVLATLYIGHAIVAEASLSFLGLGTQPPYPSWGGMLSGSTRNYLERAPWLAVYPGLILALVVLAFNMLGDAVRDALDPRLRRA